MTNQPDKLGEDEFKNIDWVISNMGGEIQNIFECPHDDNGITDYSRLLPKFTPEETIQFLSPENTKSTSDHIPVIVDFEACGTGVRLFQMNLLANLLSGDGFLKGSSKLDTKFITNIRDETKREIQRLKKQDGFDVKNWGKQGWPSFRDQILSETTTETKRMIEQLSMTPTDLNEDSFTQRLQVLVRSIILVKPDIITFQENDMYYELCNDKAFSSIYTNKGEDGSVALQLKPKSNGLNNTKDIKQIDRFRVHDGVSVYVNKGVFRIVETSVKLLSFDTPVVTALIQRIKDGLKIYVITTHLSSGKKRKDIEERDILLPELMDHVSNYKQYNVIVAMDANEDISKRA